MVAEAEKYKEEDEKVKARVEAKNNLEHYCYNMKQTVDDEKFKDKISDDDKKTIKDKCDEVLQWLESNSNAETDEITQQKNAVEGVCTPIMTKLYAEAGGAPPGAGGPGGFPGGFPGAGGAPPSDAPTSGPTIEEVD